MKTIYKAICKGLCLRCFQKKQFVFWARGFSFPFSPNKNIESKHAWRRKMKTVGNVPVETVRCLILNGCHELTIIREDPTTHICTNCVVTIYTIYIYIMKVLFRMNRSVSSGVLSYLTPRFAWRFCCLDLLQAADVSNPTRPIRTARAWNSYVYEDNLFPSKKCLIERCGQRTERRQG